MGYPLNLFRNIEPSILKNENQWNNSLDRCISLFTWDSFDKEKNVIIHYPFHNSGVGLFLLSAISIKIPAKSNILYITANVDDYIEIYKRITLYGGETISSIKPAGKLVKGRKDNIYRNKSPHTFVDFVSHRIIKDDPIILDTYKYIIIDQYTDHFWRENTPIEFSKKHSTSRIVFLTSNLFYPPPKLNGFRFWGYNLLDINNEIPYFSEDGKVNVRKFLNKNLVIQSVPTDVFKVTFGENFKFTYVHDARFDELINKAWRCYYELKNENNNPHAFQLSRLVRFAIQELLQSYVENEREGFRYGRKRTFKDYYSVIVSYVNKNSLSQFTEYTEALDEIDTYLQSIKLNSTKELPKFRAMQKLITEIAKGKQDSKILIITNNDYKLNENLKHLKETIEINWSEIEIVAKPYFRLHSIDKIYDYAIFTFVLPFRRMHQYFNYFFRNVEILFYKSEFRLLKKAFQKGRDISIDIHNMRVESIKSFGENSKSLLDDLYGKSIKISNPKVISTKFTEINVETPFARGFHEFEPNIGFNNVDTNNLEDIDKYVYKQTDLEEDLYNTQFLDEIDRLLDVNYEEKVTSNDDIRNLKRLRDRYDTTYRSDTFYGSVIIQENGVVLIRNSNTNSNVIRNGELKEIRNDKIKKGDRIVTFGDNFSLTEYVIDSEGIYDADIIEDLVYWKKCIHKYVVNKELEDVIFNRNNEMVDDIITKLKNRGISTSRSRIGVYLFPQTYPLAPKNRNDLKILLEFVGVKNVDLIVENVYNARSEIISFVKRTNKYLQKLFTLYYSDGISDDVLEYTSHSLNMHVSELLEMANISKVSEVFHGLWLPIQFNGDRLNISETEKLLSGFQNE